jgi:ATP-dependent helicase/nuclease subunit A
MIEDIARYQADDENTRLLIRERLHETQFVEAGAGTGKTRALVDRVVALVLSGEPIERIVAITFTDRAAAELRDRVRSDLEQRQKASVAEPDFCGQALQDLERAQISTIHAFAASVLRSFAAEYGIDPSFRAQDELAGERRFDERWRAFLDTAGGDESIRRAVHRVLRLGLQPRDLRTLAHELWNHGDLAELLQSNPLHAPPLQPIQLDGLIEALTELRSERAPDNDRLRIRCEQLLTALGTLKGCDEEDYEARFPVLVACLPTSMNVGQARHWGGGDAIAIARETLAGVYDQLRTVLEAMRTDALAGLLVHLVRFTTDEMQARLKDGELLFDDLILQLRNLLRDRPDARRRMRSRYRALLIDEFQDTDPQQVEIAFLFASDPDTGRIEGGRLFLVGDPKQSIYRFRRADMAVYASASETVQLSSGAALELSLNRRSRTALIHFFNNVFIHVIDGDSPRVQPPYKGIRPFRMEECEGPDVALIGDTLPGSAREVRWREAQQIAAHCRSVVGDGWQTFDRDAEETRTARYRDVAILLPSRTILQPLERALASAGVPYRVEGGSLVFATQEVRDLINCLTAIDDPTDDIAVVAALRSAAYACSDVELAEYRLAGGSFNYLWPELDGHVGGVAECLRNIRSFHMHRHQRTLASLVERFIAERGSVEAGLYVSGNRDAFRRARFVVERARAFEAAEPAPLRAFIEWMEQRAGEAIFDSEAAGLDDDEDAVRILTIHAAKGLEFPIVFLAGLGVAPPRQSFVLGFNRSTYEIGVTIGANTRHSRFCLGPVEEISHSEGEHERAERARLLYVGATRARDHLVISLYRTDKAKDSRAQPLIDAGVKDYAQLLAELPVVDDHPLRALEGLDVERYPAGAAAFKTERAILLEATASSPVTSATALARIAHGEDEAINDLRADENEPWARGRAGTHRGRAVHAALQVIPWNASEALIDAVARAQAVAEAIPAEASAIKDLIRQALSMEVSARARAARRVSREVPFALMRDGVTIEGFLDLVLELDEGLEIVDWKTDAIPLEGVADRLEAYRLQAGLYVLAIEEATHKPVQRVTYAFVHPRVEVSPGEPAALAAEALDSVRRLASDS